MNRELLIMFKIDKIIEYGLYLLVFLLPLQTRWIIKQGYINGSPYEFSTISIYAIDILLLALLVLQAIKYFINFKNDNKEIKMPGYWWALATFELITFVSIFFAPDKLIAIYKYLHLLLAIGVFWLVLNAQYQKKKLILIFLGSSVLQAFFGIGQFLTQSTFANKWLGLAVHPLLEPGTAVVINHLGERVLRAYGSLDHPNILGGLMAVALLLLAYFVKSFLTSPLPAQAGQPSPSKGEGARTKAMKVVVYYGSLIILIGGLFFSFSRAAWISYGVGILLFLATAAIKKDKDYLKFLFLNLIVCLAVFFVLAFQYKDLVVNRVSGTVYTEAKSINERVEADKISYGIIKDNWWLGVGIGNYGRVVQNQFDNLNYQLYQPVHNVYLLVASELGILGLTALILFFTYIVIFLNRAGDGYSIAIIIGILVLFLFDHWLFSLHYGIILLLLVFGTVLKQNEF